MATSKSIQAIEFFNMVQRAEHLTHDKGHNLDLVINRTDNVFLHHVQLRPHKISLKKVLNNQ